MAGSFDHATFGQAYAAPGMDPRTWISYAIVDVPGDGQGDSQTVEFDRDDGQLYVNLTLKPSDVPLRARVGMTAAGSGEAIYFPFCGGEEVLVAIPEGNLQAGAVILCRLNNAYDGFPFDSVGGGDPTKNATAIFRTRTPLTIESGASVQIRSAAAGALLLLSGQGNITLRDAKANVLQMSPDVFGFQNGDGDIVMQLDLNAKRYTLSIGQVALTLSGDAASANPQSLLQVPSTLAVGTSGLSINTAAEHVLTAEAFANLFVQFWLAVGVANPGPLTGVALAAAMATLFPASIATASATPQTPPVGAALAAAFANPAMLAAKVLPSSVALGYQSFPGIGCAGFLAGLG